MTDHHPAPPPTGHAPTPANALDSPEPLGAVETREAALRAATMTVPYLDDRPKALVPGKDFARALGLLEAVLERLDADEDAGPAALELQWAVIELDDHSTLAPAQPVRAQLPAGDRVLAAAIAAISSHLQSLVDSSGELSDTLRYLGVLEHINTAHTLVPPTQSPAHASEHPGATNDQRDQHQRSGGHGVAQDSFGDGVEGGEGRG